ncbi:NACHT, LRR and PYD domains-containing protein 12 [Geodia barretti]|uniref:NACHT, LRR and PYD domains-containing protein 12 n=1 Tax=Geodia barretti TaxID=519541 RepID=A0AA35RNP5_GEOBA|nr:NACHT, LRR and PYD domains-containing protein 12 [Geodia barretti]
MKKTIRGRSFYEAKQYETTFQFLAGIDKLETFPVGILSDLLSKDAAALYRWLYESQNQSVLTNVLGSGERELSLSYSATTTDYFAAGYCLAHSNCTWTIYLDSADDVVMEFLSKGCNHQLPETGISSQFVLVSFKKGSITDEGIRHFLTIPRPLLQSIEQLDFSSSKLDRRGCECLAEGIQRMSCLAILDLSGNLEIGNGDAVKLVSSLHSSKLTKLDMSGTSISDPDFECLASYIRSSASLEELKIRRTKISVKSIDALCKALNINSSMRKLDMWGCQLTDLHSVHLGQLLREPVHCRIEKLVLTSCNLTSNGLGKIVTGLCDNHTLKELIIRDNQMNDVAVATMLQKNSSLQRLNLENVKLKSVAVWS